MSIQRFRATTHSISQGGRRGTADARTFCKVPSQVKHGGFQRAVEHERVEGDVHVSQNPGDDDEPKWAAVGNDEEGADGDEQIYQQGDGGEGDVVLDSTVKVPHLQRHNPAQR